MMDAKPQTEHQWLGKFVGEWTYEGESPGEPGKPPMKFTGTESVRSIGGLWVMAEGKGKMPDGSPATMFLTLGYDPERKAVVGTWIGSMMTYLWHYDAGTISGNTLSLAAEGPNCMGGGGMAKFREVVEFKSDDHRVFTSSMQGEDGKWTTIMTTNYRRVK